MTYLTLCGPEKQAKNRKQKKQFDGWFFMYVHYSLWFDWSLYMLKKDITKDSVIKLETLMCLWLVSAHVCGSFDSKKKKKKSLTSIEKNDYKLCFPQSGQIYKKNPQQETCVWFDSVWGF